MDHTALLEALKHYRPHDAGEGHYLKQVRELLDLQPQDCHRRDTFDPGHVTASAWVVNEPRTHALLVHHKRLGRWLQPGGHIDSDPSVLAAAQREALEETGARCVPLSAQIFDIDVHPIPASRKEPGHLHFDIRYLLQAEFHAELTLSGESNALRWFTLDEILDMGCGPSLDRMVVKTRRPPPRP